VAERLNTAAELARLATLLDTHMKAGERDRLAQQEQAREAKEQRDGMARDILAIRQDHMTMDNRVIKIEADVKEMKPVIGSIVSTKAKFAGAIIVLGALGTMVLGFLAYFKQQISTAIWGG
jgi:predicted metal-dependent hydrolase